MPICQLTFLWFRNLGTAQLSPLLRCGKLKVCWNQPPKEGRAQRPKKEGNNSRIKEFIKGALGQMQSLKWQQDTTIPSVPKGDGGLIYMASRKIGGSQPSGRCLFRAVYSKAVNDLVGLLIYVRTFLLGDTGPRENWWSMRETCLR